MIAVLLAVLKGIGILLLVLLILLLLLLVVPVVIDAEYRPDAPRVWVCILGIPIRVWPKPWWLRRLTERGEEEEPAPEPAPQKPSPTPAPAPSQPAPEASPQPAPAQTAAPPSAAPSSQMPPSGPSPKAKPAPPPAQAAPTAPPPSQKLPGEGKVSRLLHTLSAAGAAARVACKGIWVSLWVEWPVQGQDAADTALSAGKWNARVGALCALAANLFQFRLRRLYFAPDFLGSYKQQGHIRLRVAASPVFLLAAAVAFFRQSRSEQ